MVRLNGEHYQEERPKTQDGATVEGDTGTRLGGVAADAACQGDLRLRQMVKDSNYAGLGDSSLDGVKLSYLALKCAEETFDELAGLGLLRGLEKDVAMKAYADLLERLDDEEPIPDSLMFLAQQLDVPEGEEALLSEIDRLGGAMMRRGSGRKIVHCPFLHLTRVPSIYREVPPVQWLCRRLMVPVVQAHEKELIMFGVINPVTGARAGALVAQLVEDASGRRPIPSMVIASASHWKSLNRKHFGV